MNSSNEFQTNNKEERKIKEIRVDIVAKFWTITQIFKAMRNKFEERLECLPKILSNFRVN